MKIAICDDNKEYVNEIESYIEKINADNVECEAYYSGEQLVKVYESNLADYDAIFLDMEMDGINGIETANIIRQYDKYVIIVFITSYTKYMQESFQCSPFRFLIKPVGFEGFKKVYYEMLNKISSNEQYLIIDSNKAKLRLKYSDIIYIESKNHWVFIHMKENVYKIRNTLSQFIGEIKSYDFIRTHKSYLINFNYVNKINKDNVEMYGNNDIIPISRSYKKEFSIFIEKIIERKYHI